MPSWTASSTVFSARSIRVFRLFSPWRAPGDTAGASRRGGRWNSPGTAVLYAASSLSLACLEILVHLRQIENVPELSYAESVFRQSQIESWKVPPERTHAILESEILSREMGDNWMARRRWEPARRRPLPALQVPSAVIPQEWNYVIDPEDAGFAVLRWSDPKPFHIDPRLAGPALR